MKDFYRRSRIGSVSIALAVGLIALTISAVRSHAQQWEGTFGSTCLENGKGGPIPIKNSPGGGYVAVGDQQSPFVACSGFGSRRDVYVVRTSDNGVVVWARAYSPGWTGGGGDATGNAICEDALGNFIVVGSTVRAGLTSTPLHSSCGSQKDIFVMSLSPAGAVNWCHVYSQPADPAFDEEAFSVIQSVTPRPGTQPDLIVAGRAERATGGFDGLIMRINSFAGQPVYWSRTYPSPNGGNDVFYAVTEATVGVPVGTVPDIVAVGSTFSGVNPPFFPNPDFYVARVNGANGNIGAAPQGAWTWGSAFAVDELYSVQELKVGVGGPSPANAVAGDLVMAGELNIAAGPPAPISFEAYVARTQANVGLGIAAERTYGDTRDGGDFAYGVREVPAGAAGLNAGNVVLSGCTSVPLGAPASDLFLVELNPSTLNIAGAGAVPFTTYGGTSPELRGTVEVVVPTATRTAGFALCGSTQSPALIAVPGDPEQMYLIKTDNLGASLCNDHTPTPTQTTPGLTPAALAVTPGTGVAWCLNSATWNAFDDEYWPLCFTPTTRPRNNGNDGVSGVSAPVEITGELTAYPNPVKAGDPISLKCDRLKVGKVTISVADMAGKEIFSRSEERASVAGQIIVNTTGWTNGSYMITVNDGSRTIGSRVVVMEK